MLPEALDPLGQRLRTPAERRVYRRFVSAQRLVARYEAFGQAQVKSPMSTQTRCFAQLSCSSRLFTLATGKIKAKARRNGSWPGFASEAG